MTNMEQVKERIERMRKVYPDNNGLCDLLDFVEGLVKEEKELDRVCEVIGDIGAVD
jgi:hypothetical protein